MGNMWSRRGTNIPVEAAEEERASGSIEMKGSQPLEVNARRDMSLASWPLCLPDRYIGGLCESVDRPQDTLGSSRSDISRKDKSACEEAAAVGL